MSSTTSTAAGAAPRLDAPDAATRAELLAQLGRLEQAWRALDFDAIRALWDTSRPPIYQAEEAAAPCLSWAALDAYWAATGGAITRMGMRITSEPRLVALAPDLVTAIYEMHWDCVVGSGTAPVGGDNRVYSTFRRTPDGWRLTQYVESPLAPIVYMRKLYERSVTPGFAEKA